MSHFKSDNVIAMAAYVSSNLAKAIRFALNEKDHCTIIDAWNELDVAGESKALAVLRSTMSREAKKLYGHGLKVEGGKLVAVAARKRKETEEDPKLMALAKIIQASGNADIITKVEEALEKMVAELASMPAK